MKTVWKDKKLYERMKTARKEENFREERKL